MLTKQEFKKGDLSLVLKRTDEDRALISIRKYDELQRLNLFSADIELELKDINFIVDTLKNSPFIFSERNNEK